MPDERADRVIEMTLSPGDEGTVEKWPHVLVDVIGTYGDHGLARIRITAPHAYDVPDKVRRALLQALRELW
jgi:hypothetical protein